MNTLRIPTNYIHLENRDQKLLQIENLIDAKRKILIGKQKKFKNLTKQNEFLNEVKQDYNKYYGYIVKQKEDQMSALSLLNTYIKDLTNSNSLSKNNIQDAQKCIDKNTSSFGAAEAEFNFFNWTNKMMKIAGVHGFEGYSKTFRAKDYSFGPKVILDPKCFLTLEFTSRSK